MKKLTTGIFTVLLGLVAADVNAAVTTQKYVDSRVSEVSTTVNALEQTVNKIASGDGALDPTDGSLNSGVVAEDNLETTLKNKINNKQDKSTADYALGTATGSWKALEDSEKAALTSGITSALVGKIGVGTINAELGTDLVSAVNKLKDITESLPNDSAMSTLKDRVDTLYGKVGTGALDAGEASDLIEAVNSLYDDVQSALSSINDKQTKSTAELQVGMANGTWATLTGAGKVSVTNNDGTPTVSVDLSEYATTASLEDYATTEDLNKKADATAIADMLTKTTADTTYQAKSTQKLSVGMADGSWGQLTGGNNISISDEGEISATGLVTSGELSAVSNVANSAKNTADAAIPKPTTGTCDGEYGCVLKYIGNSYVWEEIVSVED